MGTPVNSLPDPDPPSAAVAWRCAAPASGWWLPLGLTEPAHRVGGLAAPTFETHPGM